MKQILILGGGFAGVTAAKKLSRIFATQGDIAITLVDKHAYHEYHADLYELATSPEELTNTQALAASVAIPFADIFRETKVKHLRAEVTGVDFNTKQVFLSHRSLPYDYVLFTLGSQVNFYNIPGAKEFALPLKNIQDALRIRNSLEFTIQRHRQDVTKYNIRIVVVGGGFSGVELAAELVGYVDFLCWQNGYPREKVEIEIMEGANRLLCGLPDLAAGRAARRLKNLGVHVALNNHIIEVTNTLLYLANGERVEYDCLLWTAGIAGVHLQTTLELPLDRGGRIQVNEYLQVPAYHNAFFIGDSAITMYADPPTAQYAMHQASYVAYALPYFMKNRKPRGYMSKSFPYIIPLGGTWALFVGKHFTIQGWLAHVAKVWVTLQYYTKLVGLRRAVGIVRSKLIWYGRND